MGSSNLIYTTPLHFAAKEGYSEVVKILLNEKGISVNSINEIGIINFEWNIFLIFNDYYSLFFWKTPFEIANIEIKKLFTQIHEWNMFYFFFQLINNTVVPLL